MLAQPAKDFLSWHHKKELIHNSTRPFFCKEREVWWCSVGLNIGHEQDGKGRFYSRPVLVFKKFNNEMFWGIPLSTSKKEGEYFFHFSFLPNLISNALLSQLRIFDSRRLLEKKGIISEYDFNNIKKAVRDLI